LPRASRALDRPRQGRQNYQLGRRLLVGDEKNPQLQRVYGTAFFSQKAMDEHFARLEEAAKRTTACWASNWTCSAFRS